MQPARQDCHGAGPHDSLLNLGSLIETHSSVFFPKSHSVLDTHWAYVVHIVCMKCMQPAKQDCHGAGPHDSPLTLGSLIETHSLFFCFFFPSLIQFWTLTGHMWCILYA